MQIPEDAYVLLSVGELNANKNHQIDIRAIAELNDDRIHYVIAGKGQEYNNLIQLAKKLKVDKRLHLIGRRSDIPELDKMADVYILPSLREGLNVSLIEAMSSGLPCIASDIRGNRELIDEGKGGYLVTPTLPQDFAARIRHISEQIK